MTRVPVGDPGRMAGADCQATAAAGRKRNGAARAGAAPEGERARCARIDVLLRAGGTRRGAGVSLHYRVPTVGEA